MSRDDRFRNLLRRHPQDTCSLAVYGDLYGRVIEFLLECEVAQRRHLRQHAAQLFGILPAVGEVRSAHRYFNRSRRNITRLTMALGSNEKRTPGSSWANFWRSRSFKSSMRITVPRLSCTCSTASSEPELQR
jgi:hypothetical protein